MQEKIERKGKGEKERREREKRRKEKERKWEKEKKRERGKQKRSMPIIHFYGGWVGPCTKTVFSGWGVL